MKEVGDGELAGRVIFLLINKQWCARLPQLPSN